MRTAREEAARLLNALQKASPEAVKAYDLIVKLDTREDFIAILAAIYQAIATVQGYDYSQTLSRLQEADEQLDEAVHITQEELNEGYASLAAEGRADERRAA